MSDKSKWSVDFASLESTSRTSNIPSPVGFDGNWAIQNSRESSKASRSADADHNDMTLKARRAWDVAMGPAKTIPMNAIMIYMSGTGVQIFSVMITAMLFWQPIKAIFTVNQTFERFEPTGAAKNHPEASLLTSKATFLALQLVTIGLGIYKVNAMGLLPTTTSDWLAFMPPKQIMEYFSI
ncbi:transmembrane protein 85-like protein [Umbelopsis sp. AD052]|nr:transmembrane protein 85-like protein [Umbelopsis sp. AD052]